MRARRSDSLIWLLWVQPRTLELLPVPVTDVDRSKRFCVEQVVSRVPPGGRRWMLAFGRPN